MKLFNSKLAAIGLAAFVFASCSDSTSEVEQHLYLLTLKL